MASKRCNHGNEFDRLTELPDSLLHHIMSYLQIDDNRPFRTIATLGMASKACYQAWLSYPYPHLSFVFERTLKNIDRYLQWARDRGLTLERLKIDVSLKNPDERLIRWCNFLRAIHVQVIDLRIVSEDKFTMLVSFFSGMNSLQELTLHRCFLIFDVELPSLKKLRLDHIKHYSYQTVEDIVKYCPKLEHLEIVFCSGIHGATAGKKSIYLAGLSNLKSVSIVDSSSAEANEILIDAPQLEEFSISWQVHRPRFNAASWSGLRKLCLKGRFGIENEVLDELLRYLTLLEYLSIKSSMRKWKKPRISSSSIREIQLSCGNFKGVLHIECPNLRLFSYQGSYTPRLDQTSTFSWDCKFDLSLNKQGHKYQHKDQLINELEKFFMCSKITRVSCLQLDISEKYWTDQLNEWYEKILARDKVNASSEQPAQLKCLKLELRGFKNNIPCGLLYGLLCICHPELLILTFHEVNQVHKHALEIMLKTGVIARDMLRGGSSLKEVKLVSLGSGKGKDKEVNKFQDLNFDALTNQRNHEMGPLNLRVGLKLKWQ